ncbi:Protein S-acyltransferase 10 [Raphanus sativus]|nr:Protein S-acyltransferase 10 [Raphanus sativus]
MISGGTYCEKSALCIWTLIMYIDYLSNVEECNYHTTAYHIGDLLDICAASFAFPSYLILTTQSIYELVRRKRIPYMRNIRERVHPFSRAIKRNLYKVCCSNDTLDSLPTAYELEDRSRISSYTCLDILNCRCC